MLKNALKRSVKIVEENIIAHQRLFDEVFVKSTPEIQAIIHQMIHGKPQDIAEVVSVYRGWRPGELRLYAKQRIKPTFNRIKRALKAAQCRLPKNDEQVQ